MPLHHELEYERLHFTHPRRYIEAGKTVHLDNGVQYMVMGDFTIEAGAQLILEVDSDLLVMP
jgi:hypothetical protein